MAQQQGGAYDAALQGGPSQAQIDEFVQLAHCSEEQARFLLEACAGDMEAALQMFFDQAPSAAGGQQGFPGAVHQGLPPRPNAPVMAGRQQAGPEPGQQGTANRGGGPGGGGGGGVGRLVPALIVTAVRIPIFLLRTTFGIASASIALGLGVAGYMGDRVLPARVMRSIRGVAAALAGGQDLDALAQAQHFIQQFKKAYGDRHPRWVAQELQQACLSARNDHRFLLVYLHSPEHEDTAQFCRDVLCEPDLVTYANQNFTSWGGDIQQSDAHALSIRLGATTYPFVAVLSMGNNNKASVIRASQGHALLRPGALLQTLTRCVEDHGALLVAQRAELQERETTRRLLEEQNAEYEASLAADREREAARAAERRRQEEEAREAAEAAAREQAAKDAVERRRQERADAIVSRRAAKRAQLPAEATKEAAGAAGVALVRVRLPDGGNAQRSFAADSPLRALFDFVDSLDAITCWRYNLVSNYPRMVYTHPDAEQQGATASPADAAAAAVCKLPPSATLAEAGLAPHAALFVQPVLDEEDEEAGAAV